MTWYLVPLSSEFQHVTFIFQKEYEIATEITQLKFFHGKTKPQLIGSDIVYGNR